MIHKPHLNARFITFEGGEGSGKSTQIKRVCAVFEKTRHPFLSTREPGGTPYAETIREEVLSGIYRDQGKAAEAVLLYNARHDHLEKMIRPSLREGKHVICDRFHDSTHVYQGVLGGVDSAFLDGLDRIIIEDTLPDLTVLLDIDPVIALERRRKRLEQSGISLTDQFESLPLDQHILIRQAFLARAEKEPSRFVVIDASQSIDKVTQQILTDGLTRISIDILPD